MLTNTSCTLLDNGFKDGISIPESLLSTYKSQDSLVYLSVIIQDLSSLKHLLVFLPNLSTLCIRFDLCTSVQLKDRDTFSQSICSCSHLSKLVIR